ncbi:hypothetical protein BJ166DRAFT_141086 [Pestalotiopsis sp. NC0098]|nr:hypothetical protein BJ166DRAFT_141086 [Pestalotiopsis sp. NC0098]
MAWYSSALPVPPEISSLIGWLAFFFKVMSLLFAGPLIALILFDICLWVWRLLVRASPRSPLPSASKHSKPSKQQPQPVGNTGDSAKSTSVDAKPVGGDLRNGYAATAAT